jgi:hypothetical protein
MVQNEGIPSSAACDAGAETLSRQNSGRKVHWRINDSMLSMSSRNPGNLPFAWSKIDSISSPNLLRNAGGCRRRTQR